MDILNAPSREVWVGRSVLEMVAAQAFAPGLADDHAAHAIGAYGSKINNVTLSSSNGVAETVTLNAAFKSTAFDTITSFDATDDKIALKVVKNDGTRQEFDRKKLLGGLLKACEKRPVPVLAFHGTGDFVVKYEGGRFAVISSGFDAGLRNRARGK